MKKGANYYNALTREVVKRHLRRSKMWREYLMADGHPPGTEPRDMKRRVESLMENERAR